ncbi:hypothetical protein KVT40_003594 [Elsinoe batatas]|uniref:Rhodopsin domain-containing protein n=1 Tax=Elsinoe batatas TaxID=2601811 RepID=A0A8K0PFC6_9PEZI|nr:hypothetical protein KVT40_003594 [Elsinoe batatas]
MSAHDRGTAVKREGNLLACASTMIALSGITVIGRLYSHLAITKNFGVDDVFIIFAWLFSVAVLGSFVMQDKYGLGYHAADLTPDEVSQFLKYLWLTLWTYNGALTCTKFSLLFQYRRIFITPRFQIAVKVMIGILVVYGLWTFFGCIFICWPIESFWNLKGTGKCMATWPIFIGNTVMNIINDFMVILSPMPVLTNLHLPKRQKIALMAVFAVGGFVIIVSILRLAQFIKSNGATDFSWENIILGIWSIIECTVGIICSSGMSNRPNYLLSLVDDSLVPALKPLIVRLFPNFGSTNSGTRSRTYGQEQSRGKTNADTERGNVTMMGHEEEKTGGHGEVVELSKNGPDGINVVTTTTVQTRGYSVNSQDS